MRGEGAFVEQNKVSDDACCPNIDFIGVPLLFYYLRSHVIGSAAHIVPLPIVGIMVCGQSEIRQFDFKAGVQQDVTGLDVAMDDLVGLSVDENLDQLADEVPGLRLGQAFSLFDEIVETLYICFQYQFVAELENEVVVAVVFEGIEQF